MPRVCLLLTVVVIVLTGCGGDDDDAAADDRWARQYLAAVDAEPVRPATLTDPYTGWCADYIEWLAQFSALVPAPTSDINAALLDYVEHATTAATTCYDEMLWSVVAGDGARLGALVQAFDS
jgi:hypothetical protein